MYQEGIVSWKKKKLQTRDLWIQGRKEIFLNATLRFCLVTRWSVLMKYIHSINQIIKLNPPPPKV